jgi:hypothetical protein
MKGVKTGRASSTVFKKGNIPWCKGKKIKDRKRLSLEDCEKIRLRMLGKKNALKKVV